MNLCTSRLLKTRVSFRDGPSGAGPETMNTGKSIDFSGPCSWIPGSRAKPALRNDDVPAFFRSLLMARWRRLRVTLHDLRGGHAHRYIDAHQGFHPDIGRLDPCRRDIDQRAPDRDRRGGDEDHMVRLAADQDRSGHRQ